MHEEESKASESVTTSEQNDNAADAPAGKEPAIEIGGRSGPDPTRYGDWEKNGRCVDF